MDLIRTYLYITSPIVPENIDEKTFEKMKTDHWYRDSRGSKKFQILNKRFKIDQNWYRVMVRFEKMHDGTYVLNEPIPFIIVETETEDEVIFIDRKIHHGRKVKHTLGYIDSGIPMELIDMVIQNLKDLVVYME